MPRRKPGGRPRKSGGKPPAAATSLRIVGGTLGGRQIRYSGDPRVRPMKDRTREAVFNLLGPIEPDCFVMDLFGGTGAMVCEAISRGAREGICVEQHVPTVQNIKRNLIDLGIQQQVQVHSTDAFRWVKAQSSWPTIPWLVFICPPYRLFVERTSDLLTLIETMTRLAPVDSQIVVESDDQFDPSTLSEPEQWRVRTYPPAVISIRWKGPIDREGEGVD